MIRSDDMIDDKTVWSTVYDVRLKHDKQYREKVISLLSFRSLFHLSYDVLLSVSEEMHKFIGEQLNTSRVPLCINPQSAAFKSFAR